MEDVGASHSDWDARLPSRLFATDRYPQARLNVYSKPDTLSFIREVLERSPEFDKILGSCFGPLFHLPVSRCPSSCKLMHALLCRQLITKKKYEMWTMFGGKPLRFSLSEFGSVTGLPCGEFPEDYDAFFDPSPQPGRTTYWHELIGPDMHATLGDVSDLLHNTPVNQAERRLRLAYILIVDGVLIASHQSPRPTFKYVEMLQDLESFLSFPWGRKSFLKTISSMRPVKKIVGNCSVKRIKVDDPIQTFTHQLQQQTICLKGFPLALQLLAFRSIFGLVDTIPDDNPTRTMLLWKSLTIPKQSIPLSQIHAVEQNPALAVDPFIAVEDPPSEGWYEWDDEVKDKRVDWPGGHDSLPLIPMAVQKTVVAHKRHIVSRHIVSRRKKPVSKITESRPMRVKTTPSKTAKKTSTQGSMNLYQDLVKQVEEISGRVYKLENKLKAAKLSKSSRIFRRYVTFRSKRRFKKKKKLMNNQPTVLLPLYIPLLKTLLLR